MRKFGFVLACVLVAIVVSTGQTLSPEVRGFVKVDAPVVALTHVRVIDGTGAAAREDQTVVLSHGKIESVSDAASASVPKDAQVVDLHGYSLIPGLVGMHERVRMLGGRTQIESKPGGPTIVSATLPPWPGADE